MHDNDPSSLKPAIVFSGGLVGGYQHYFGKSQRNGIKASIHLYSGYAKWNYSNSRSRTTMMGSDTDSYTSTLETKISYIPIQAGLEVKYLWDFFQSGKHTLGLNVGLGYEFDYYIANKTESEYSETHSIAQYNIDKEKNSEKLDSKMNLLLNKFYPVIGLHYYYGHHQFELLYRFGGIINQMRSKTIRDDDRGDDGTYYGYSDITMTIKSNDYLTFNYTYRF